MAFGKIGRVRVDGVIAGCDVDETQDPFERDVVDEGFEGDGLVAAAEVDVVEDDGVDNVEADCGGVEVGREDGSRGEGDGDDEGGEEVEECFVDLLEDEDLGSDLPPAEFPVEEDVCHVVVHACYEKVIPLSGAGGSVKLYRKKCFICFFSFIFG